MKLHSLSLRGFRCFGDATTILFGTLTAFVGTNGTGKTAALIGLARMFGTHGHLRRLTKDDFHRAPEVADPAELSLTLDAIFVFPELLSGEPVTSSAVPECLRHILVEESDDVPRCRIRLTATWRKTSTAEGDIEERIEWIDSLAEAPEEESVHRLGAVERSLIQVFYVPAARDAMRELRTASGTILARALSLVSWPDTLREELARISQEMSQAFRSHSEVTALETALGTHWRSLRGDSVGDPELAVAESDLAGLLRRLDARLRRSGAEPVPLTLLSEGEQSLLYFALVAAALEFEADTLAHGPSLDAVPAILTILAVEEPENHLAPQYLSRILRTLRAIQARQNAQVAITSHSSAILRRIDPTEIRHFRLADDGKPTVSHIVLPEETDDALKYVREAVQAHPELYFATVVVLCEGASEEFVLPRLARAHELDVDPRFVAVVPLGGRHVRYFWRLLRQLGTPYVTLVDLDNERSGGGWSRLVNLDDELQNLGPSGAFAAALAAAKVAEMPTPSRIAVGDAAFAKCAQLLEEDHDVFLSMPLDLDLLLLEAFTDEYRALAPAGGGPRIPQGQPARSKRLERAVVAVLGAEGGDGQGYPAAARELFPWYSYLFLAGSKPVAHARAFALLGDAKLNAQTPPTLRRLIDRLKTLSDG